MRKDGKSLCARSPGVEPGSPATSASQECLTGGNTNRYTSSDSYCGAGANWIFRPPMLVHLSQLQNTRASLLVTMSL